MKDPLPRYLGEHGFYVVLARYQATYQPATATAAPERVTFDIEQVDSGETGKAPRFALQVAYEVLGSTLSAPQLQALVEEMRRTLTPAAQASGPRNFPLSLPQYNLVLRVDQRNDGAAIVVDILSPEPTLVEIFDRVAPRALSLFSGLFPSRAIPTGALKDLSAQATSNLP